MSAPNYVGSADDYGSEQVIVWERTEENGREAVRYNNPYYFYVPNENGSYTSMYGHKLTKLVFDNREEYTAAKSQFPLKFESDFSSLDKVLMDNYYGLPTPVLHFSFFDIEVDVDDEGFATPAEARCPVNAFTIYHQWEDTFYLVALPPPDWEPVEFLPDPSEFGYDACPNVQFELVLSEVELLERFLELIKDTDFISGWNSEFFDVPYMYNRIKQILGEKATRELCFPGAPSPRVREVERFGKIEQVIAIYGRSHLDYLAMFKKFTFEGRASFALTAICEEELGVTKLEYDGSLADLYRNDFKHFCTYNLIDVLLLKKLDLKFNFVALVNQMAHENTVQFEQILGTTKYVDCGTTNYAHHFKNVIVKDKDTVGNHGKVEGAIVLTPNKGLHEWVGSVDIASLYPSVLRSLNISPETFIGQFDTAETYERMQTLPEVQQLIKTAEKYGVSLDNFFIAMAKETDFYGIYYQDDYLHTALVDGQYLTMTGKQWHKYLKQMKWVVSGYGTIFDQSGEQGVIPSVLTYWYSERKALQKQLKEWKKKAKELREQNATDVS